MTEIISPVELSSYLKDWCFLFSPRAPHFNVGSLCLDQLRGRFRGNNFASGPTNINIEIRGQGASAKDAGTQSLYPNTFPPTDTLVGALAKLFPSTVWKDTRSAGNRIRVRYAQDTGQGAGTAKGTPTHSAGRARFEKGGGGWAGNIRAERLGA